MEMLKTLLETEESQKFLSEHQEIILENAEDISNFGEVLKEFVIQNPNYFLEPDLDTTYKNIKMFSEVAISQYLSEVTNILSNQLHLNESNTNNSGLNEYL